MRGLVWGLDHCSNLYNVDGEREYEQCSATGKNSSELLVNKQGVGVRKDAGTTCEQAKKNKGVAHIVPHS